MRYRFALIACCALLAASGAQAARTIDIRTNTAGELADVCGASTREAAGDARIDYCHGFAQGAISAQRAFAPDKKLFCIPSPGPSRTETMNQYVAWVRANPGRGAMPSIEGLFKFLGERFPCKS